MDYERLSYPITDCYPDGTIVGVLDAAVAEIARRYRQFVDIVEKRRPS